MATALSTWHRSSIRLGLLPDTQSLGAVRIRSSWVEGTMVLIPVALRSKSQQTIYIKWKSSEIILPEQQDRMNTGSSLVGSHKELCSCLASLGSRPNDSLDPHFGGHLNDHCALTPKESRVWRALGVATGEAITLEAQSAMRTIAPGKYMLRLGDVAF